MQLFELVAQRWITIMIRGILILGPMMLLFWVWKPRWTEKFRIPQLVNAKTLTSEELPRTVLGLSVFVIPFFFATLVKTYFDHSMMYTDIATYGWAYFFLSYFLFAFTIDTWFYWTHRAMHSNSFLRKRHAVHHRSLNTTPITSYSFDIVEALINMFPYFVLVMVLPWHPLMLLTYSLWGIFYVGYVHLGYDFFPEWREKGFLLRWAYSSTHHSIHHQCFHGNYAVYFTFWDRLMGTELKMSDANTRRAQKY